MMNREVQKWLALLTLLFGISLAGCGTEIGNGFSQDDGVTNKREDRKAASPQNGAAEDLDNDIGGETGAFDDADDQLVESDGGDDGDNAGVTAPNFSGAIPYPQDILYIPCGSPFGDGIKAVDYDVSVDNEPVFKAEWTIDGWEIFGENSGSEPIRRVTPDENNEVITEAFVGAKVTPLNLDATCANRQSEEAGGPQPTVRTTTVDVTFADTVYTLSWQVTATQGPGSISTVTVETEGKDPVEFTFDEL